MSNLIEHEILAAGFISISWKCFFNSQIESIPITVPILLTIMAIVSIYFSYSIEKRWIIWNCDTVNYQLKNINRHSQTMGFWCIFLLLFIGYLLSLTNNSIRNVYFPLIILILINYPLTLRFLLFYLLRKWKLSCLSADISSIILNLYLLRSFFQLQWISTIFLSILPSLFNSFLTPKLMRSAAKSFTLGEYQLIYSGVGLALVASIKLIFVGGDFIGESGEIFKLLAWSLLSCFIFSSLCFTCSIVRRSAVVFWFILFVLLITAYLLCLFINGLDLLSWIANFLLFSTNREIIYRRWILFTFWLLCVACTIRFAIASWSMVRLGTVHRKFFHLTIGLVITSGLLYDRSLTILASVLILDGFIILEIIRLCDVEPIGKAVREIFSKFLDHQDQGPLVLTPIYLLIGCFVPIWIDFPISGIDDIRLRHFAGLIAVGVGDAAAAIGGTYFGRTPWLFGVNTGRKTVQGTICGFLAQIATIFCILNGVDSFSLILTGTNIVWIILSCFWFRC